MSDGLYAKYQTDPEAEVNGRWKTFAIRTDPSDPKKRRKVRWRIASTDPIGNPNFARESEKALRGLRKPEDADPEELEERQLDVVSRVIVLEWENQDNPNDPKGPDLPYSPENVRMILGDRKMRKFYEEVLEFAANYRNYLAHLPEDDAKN